MKKADTLDLSVADDPVCYNEWTLISYSIESFRQSG